MIPRPILIIFGGLPGTGKTSIARELAKQIGAVFLRIDSIEHALHESGKAIEPPNDAGYRVAYAVAEDNLRAGQSVITDCVNPWPITRDAYVDVARRAQVPAVEVEIACSDAAEHRRPVEDRLPDIAGFELPTWKDVISRDYRPWDHEHIVIDTAGQTIEQSVTTLRASIAEVRSRGFR
jgi:predicted kinase